MYRYFLALRYLASRPINLLGMIGVMVGVWALILVVSIFSGFIQEVRHHVKDATSDLSALRLPWPCSYRAYEKLILSDPNVAACAPRIVWYGLLHPFGKTHERLPNVHTIDQAGADSPLVVLLGIDPTREASVTGLSRWLAQVQDPVDRVPDPDRPFSTGKQDLPVMIMSRRRLAFEYVQRGNKVRISSARLLRERGGQALRRFEQDFRIGGAYHTLHTGFDNAHVLVDIGVLRRLLSGNKDDVVTEISIRCKDPRQSEATAGRLAELLNENRPRRSSRILVLTWEQRHQAFLSAVEHQRSLMKLVLFVIMVVAGFLMYATLSMMVTEKTYDIGIITAMGGTRLGVLAIFGICGISLVLLGTILGVTAGCLSAVHLDQINSWLKSAFDIDLFPPRIYNLERVPHELDPVWIGHVALMALGLGIVVSGIPAWRASRHDPVEALRNE